jgi:F-type H+-transporting ATPase subunit alpha
MKISDLSNIIQSKLTELSKTEIAVELEECGKVVQVMDGIAIVYGLKNVQYNEMVIFETGVKGFVMNLKDDSIGIAILNDNNSIKEGDTVKRTKKLAMMVAGKGLLGRVVNAVGEPIDGKGPLVDVEEFPLEGETPDIISRKSVFKPMQTGIKIIDALIPIGRGQRELIIGDRQTGKSTIALDTIINQKNYNDSAPENEKVYCIYVAIGQKQSSVARIIRMLEENSAMEYTTVVVATAAETATMQYIAPYAGSVIGEYFRDNGMHSLIIYDDLSKHAVAYRQLSLLLKRPPGREAYPGDVFYLHSRLLERSAQLSDAKGGGSMTALPIVETQGGDVSSYIPTNVISITDGQIFLETDLFYKGIRPAVNIGLSVSRVGSAAQTKAMKSVAGKIKLELAQYREMEGFAQFSSDLDATTRKLLSNGQKMIELLKQKQHHTYPMNEQVVLLFAAINGYLEKINVSDIKFFEIECILSMRQSYKTVLDAIKNDEKLTDETVKALHSIISDFIEQRFKPSDVIR